MGFRKGTHARLSYWVRSMCGLDPWTSNSLHVIYLDFSRAFDSVPQQRLKIRGNILRWIEVFLSDREQRVLVDGQSSDWEKVTSGVPQWSILEPLLFLMYVNDINVELNSSVRLFADDCAIFREITCKKDCDDLQADLNRLYY